MSEPNQNNKKKPGGKKPGRGLILALILSMLLTMGVNYGLSTVQRPETKEVSYGDFRRYLENGELAEAEFRDEYIFMLTKKEAAKGESLQTYYYAAVIDGMDPRPEVEALLSQEIAAIRGHVPETMNPILAFLLTTILPLLGSFLLLLLLFNLMSKKMGSGGGGVGGIGGFGKSKAKVYMEKSTGVTFADVAGQDEAKESLTEIIDFLHNPQKYTDIGAKLPKGALLVGSPGTGKTLIAKAVAGEAKVPFFSISGSDFVEMFVGVGASRVRDLFSEAAKVAPCIIFIDEIDAIGRTRDSRLGGNDEREQTLNQLLAEIDGFDSSKGVVILAATNRPEILDKALLRAGRFDRRIVVDRPNLAGRYQTLKVHTRNIKLSEDVDLNKIAQATAGAVGADLANLVNEAALRAVRQGRQTVNQEDLMVSFELVIAGPEKKGTVLTDTEKRIVAYHEVGHALVSALEKHTLPVTKITIVPHTSGALGYTMYMPEEEKFLNSKEELLVELMSMLGGRAAEQAVFGIMTTGAANDIERATELARKMVTQFGMSDRFGLMALSTVSNTYLDGVATMNCADATAAAADVEIKTILDGCYSRAVTILQENRALLDEISLYLLQKETITGDELMAFVNKTSHLPEAEIHLPEDEESPLTEE